MLQLPCCCAAGGGGIVDPGSGQNADCNLFDTCIDAGWLPDVVGYTVTGNRLTFGLPFEWDSLVYYWPDTTVLITDVRTSPIGIGIVGNSILYRFDLEVDFSADIDCTSCQTSESGTLSGVVYAYCQNSINAENRIFGVYGDSTTFLPSSCDGGGSGYTLTFGNYGQPFTRIRHSEIDGTGCVALSQVSFVLPISVSYGTTLCGGTSNEAWPNPSLSNVINLAFQLVSEPSI